MLRTEVRMCRKCKKTYIWKGGGIVMSPKDIDFGLCPKCRKKEMLGHLSMIFSAKWQNLCAEKIPMPMLV